MARTKIPVNIRSMTEGNFVLRAKASKRYENMIKRGKTNKMVTVFIGNN